MSFQYSSWALGFLSHIKYRDYSEIINSLKQYYTFELCGFFFKSNKPNTLNQSPYASTSQLYVLQHVDYRVFLHYNKVMVLLPKIGISKDEIISCPARVRFVYGSKLILSCCVLNFTTLHTNVIKNRNFGLSCNFNQTRL